MLENIDTSILFCFVLFFTIVSSTADNVHVCKPWGTCSVSLCFWMRVGDMDSGQSSGSRALWTQQRCPPALHGLVSISLMGLEHFLFLQLSIFLFYGRNLLEELSQPQVKSSKCRQNVPFELESGCGACFLWGFPGGSVVKSSPAIAGAARDVGLIPGSGSSPGGGNGYPLQYSFLENPMDRGAWLATVHGVIKRWISLSN